MFEFLMEKYSARLRANDQRWSRMQEALGRIEARQLSDLKPDQIHGAEFSVYSQWGEDGILQHLFRHVPISNKVFVEFGVENYTEANTRFLLIKDNWTGLVMDGNEGIDYIRRSATYRSADVRNKRSFLLGGFIIHERSCPHKSD